MSPLGGWSFHEWMWYKRNMPKETYYLHGFGLLRDLASGMAFIHSQNIVHGDLKPGNIILFDEGGARPVGKVADFGLARIRDNQSVWSTTTAIVATPCFHAPEITTMNPFPIIGKRKLADVWAYGMVAYCLSMNCLEPFKELKDSEQKLAAIREGEKPECPAGTPDDLVNLYRLCCQDEPNA